MKNKVYTLCAILFLSLSASLGVYAQTVTGTIKDSETNEAMVGVSVAIAGTSKGAVTDAQGKYTLALPAGKSTLQVSFIGYEAISREVTLQEGETQTLDFQLNASSQQLGEVSIVGSRNASRSILDSPVPVDVLSLRDLAPVVPQTDLNQMLTYLAPSFQSNRQTISDGTDHIDPATLRGLGPDQVLVLVNGKRRHNTALVNVNGTIGRGNVGTDLNTIPTAAIDRIEVLRDGAAAQYGSDAIAGVINVVLKKNVNQLRASYTSGIHKEGDGLLNQINGNYGFGLGEKGGYINITADYTFRGFTNRMKEWEGAIYGTPYLNDPKLNPEGATTDDQLIALRGLKRSDFNMRIGNSQVSNATAMFNMSVPITGGGEFYAFGGLNYRNGEAAGFYRLPSQATQVVYKIYPNGFLPEIHSFVIDRSLGVGVKGKIKDWNVDFSNTYGYNRFRFQIENSLNASMDSTSLTSFDSGGFSFSQNVSSLGMTRFFSDVMSGLNVAMGTELRIDNYQIFAGQEESYRDYDGATTGRTGGAQVFPGFQPRNALSRFRTNLAFYADIEADITKQWMVAVAGRFENYSDFGSTINGKIATRVNFWDGKFAIRGAASTGFRAPALHQLYFNTVSTLFTGGLPFEVGTFSNSSQAANILGIPKLKEETSVNLSFGITARPFDKFSLSIDYYNIKVDNRIVLTGQFAGVAAAPVGSQDRQIYDLLASIGANRAQFFSNSINTTTKGLDIIATYNWEISDNSKLDISLAANFNKTTIDKVNASSPLLVGKENIYLDRENEAVIETGNPQSKANLTLNYKAGKFNAMLRNAYFGKITYWHPNAAPQANAFTSENEIADQVFDPKVVTDISLSYQLTPNLNLQVGANNLLDVYPDKHTHSVNYSLGRFPYSRRATQFGFNGAFYFARLGISL